MGLPHPTMMVDKAGKPDDLKERPRFKCCRCCKGAGAAGHTLGKDDVDFHAWPCPNHQKWSDNLNK